MQVNVSECLFRIMWWLLSAAYLACSGRCTLSIDPMSLNVIPSSHLRIVSRDSWTQRSPKDITVLDTPVPYIVIHHSYKPDACYNRKQCSQAMRYMQDYHMEKRGWWDIGYNFAVGSDGLVYEGRGWSRLGAHSLYFNTISLGICLIGNWTDKIPPPEQLIATKDLIEEGVEKGYITSDYTLLGHRQVRETECPGDALFHEITGWPHHRPHPNSVRELLEVDELDNEIKLKIRKQLQNNGSFERHPYSRDGHWIRD